MQNDIELLLEIIDKRIRKILKEEHICYRHIAKVQSGGSYAVNTSTPVVLLGFGSDVGETYYFINRSSNALNAGDLVYVDTIGNNLNSGIITGVYKYNNEIFID